MQYFRRGLTRAEGENNSVKLGPQICSLCKLGNSIWGGKQAQQKKKQEQGNINHYEQFCQELDDHLPKEGYIPKPFSPIYPSSHLCRLRNSTPQPFHFLSCTKMGTFCSDLSASDLQVFTFVGFSFSFLFVCGYFKPFSWACKQMSAMYLSKRQTGNCSKTPCH